MEIASFQVRDCAIAEALQIITFKLLILHLELTTIIS